MKSLSPDKQDAALTAILRACATLGWKVVTSDQRDGPNVIGLVIGTPEFIDSHWETVPVHGGTPT